MPSKTDSRNTAEDTPIDMTLIKALGHPLRYRALHILNKRIASPTEIARELKVPVGKLAYHIRQLQKLGCIELVSTEPRRGATEHFYRASARAQFSDADWVKIPPSLKDDIVVAHMEAICPEISRALAQGTFNRRPDRHQSYTPMLVDGQGWTDTMGVLKEAFERVFEIQAESQERLVDSGEESVRLAVSLMGFETASKTE